MFSDHRANSETIQKQVEDIIAAGALGKSDAYARLLRFLADRAHTQKSVKEIEIAIDVFGRDEAFDVTQDSLVRVYIHKLRTKLSVFYETNPGKYSYQLSIPKGSYILTLVEAEPTPNSAKINSLLQPNRLALVATSLLIGALIVAGINYGKIQKELQSQAIQSNIWAPLNANHKPTADSQKSYWKSEAGDLRVQPKISENTCRCVHSMPSTNNAGRPAVV